MSDVDDQIARARAAMERIAGDYSGQLGQVARTHQRRVRHAAGEVGRRFRRVAITDAVILAAVILFSFLVSPIGFFGFLALILLLCAVNLFILLQPTTGRAPSPEKLRGVDLKALPAQTERWLAAQRPALPAPAIKLVDSIGQKLEALSPQLARVDGGSEEAFEVRRLVGEQLPAFVSDYNRVPPTLRATERNGRSPDAELVDGLKLIEREIADMTQRLAAGDLDQLQTRGRYLEMKYKDEGQG